MFFVNYCVPTPIRVAMRALLASMGRMIVCSVAPLMGAFVRASLVSFACDKGVSMRVSIEEGVSVRDGTEVQRDQERVRRTRACQKGGYLPEQDGAFVFPES